VKQEPTAFLLTGAGFTHDFGGYLAKDMWAAIFNHRGIQASESLQRKMYEGYPYNFEAAYDNVVSGDFPVPEKQAMTEAVRAAYADMDENIRRFADAEGQPALNSVVDFIEKFAGGPNTPGFFFTLNQDLFIERRLPFNCVVNLPGLRKAERFNTRYADRAIEEITITLPDRLDNQASLLEAPTDGKPNLYYVKLHGSMEWLDSKGRYRPVIGTQKTQIISDEPLLTWYLELFRTTLRRHNNQKLVVIGYGFGDAHVNETIAEAVQHSGILSLDRS
jgi:hypothetical protein